MRRKVEGITNAHIDVDADGHIWLVASRPSSSKLLAWRKREKARREREKSVVRGYFSVGPSAAPSSQSSSDPEQVRLSASVRESHGSSASSGDNSQGREPEMKPNKPIAWRRRLHAKLLSEKFQRWLGRKLASIGQPDADR